MDNEKEAEQAERVAEATEEQPGQETPTRKDDDPHYDHDEGAAYEQAEGDA